MRIPLFSLGLILMSLSAIQCSSPRDAQKLSTEEQAYKNEWKTVDSLVERGLYKSAQPLVEEVLEKSISANLPGSATKALRYSLEFSEVLREDAEAELWGFLKEKTEVSPSPTRNLLAAAAANQLWSYYRAHQWEIANRKTSTESKDVREWSRERFVKETASFYEIAFEDPALLHSVRWREVQSILMSDTASCNPDKSLLDLMAPTAIEFYVSNEVNLQSPGQIIPSIEKLFAPNAEFVDLNPESARDSFWDEAIRLFQERTLLHMADRNETALAELVIERLNVFKRQNFIDNKDELYEETLTTTKAGLKSDEARAIVSLALAEFYEQQGGYQPDSRDGQTHNHYARAIALCDEVLKVENCPVSLCKPCEAIQSRIRAKELSSTTEKFILPGEPWRSVVNYRNISECYYTVISFDYQKYREIMEIRDPREQARSITSTALLRSFGSRLELNDGGDFRPHSFEIAHPPLEKGFYLMLAAPHGNLLFDSTNISINPFWVTDIAWMHRLDDKHRNEFRFVDRKKGTPRQRLQVQVVGQKYNSYRRKLEMIPGRVYVPDSNGVVTVPHETTDSRFALHITNNEEELWLDHSFYQGSPPPARQPYTQIHFYTDRAVYRPGQKVHFKGIAVLYDKENRSANSEITETVFLYDANSQVVDKVKLTTNEFGSYSGSFEIPTTGITGAYRIESGRGQHYFNVEEYKRPTFRVQINPADSAFELGGAVTISGEANSLAGFPIKSAEVRYRVTRTLEQPIWWRFGWPQPGTEREIAAGKTTTGDGGEFQILFAAVHNEILSPNQFYQFNVEVDVIDMSGETRSGSHSLRMGAQSLLLGANIPEVLHLDQLSDVEVNATNLNGEPVSTDVRVVLRRLEMPMKPLKNRIYAQPDQFQLDSLEFKSRFPNDVYKSDAEIQSAAIDTVVLSSEVSTSSVNRLGLKPPSALASGWYELELSAIDRKGRKVKFNRRFTLVNDNASANVVPAFLWTHCRPMKALPGDAVEVWVSSSVTSTVWLETEIAGEIASRQQIQLDAGMRKIVIPVTEDHRGNFGIHLSTVYDNRHYSDSHLIEVPYNNKKLDVKLISTRDLLEPGAKETWTVQVASPEGNNVRTELLAGMYDASLDVLGFENQWSLNPFSLRNISRGWQDGGAFSAAGSWQHQRDWFQIEGYYHQDQCRIDFGGNQIYRNGEMFMMADDEVMVEKSNLSIGVVEPAVTAEKKDSETPEIGQIPLRSDFNETAFFIPQLRTEGDGSVSFEFTLPESLTTWKWMLLAHTSDLKHGTDVGSIISRKPLMVLPNAPRFLRQGDTLDYTASVINQSDSTLDIQGAIAIKELQSDADLTKTMIPGGSTKALSLKPGKSAVLQWEMVVPDIDGILSIEIVAASNYFSDGERRPMPVLSRKMLVTESLPISLAEPGTKTYEWENLTESSESGKEPHAVTLEFSANPAWYAVQALPYMMEYPHDCSEQIFSRFYANALAGHIVASKPLIAKMFKQYAESNPEALLSNLEKNTELKELLLEETPWLLDAQNETENKKRMALLFEMDKMSKSQQEAIQKLAQAQLEDGSWPWFKGMRSDRYITQYIVAGLGRLQKLGVEMEGFEQLPEMTHKAVKFLDKTFVEALKDSLHLKSERLHAIDLHYLYTRSLYPEHAKSKELTSAMELLWPKARKQWTELDIYSQAMLAVAAKRHNQHDLSDQIVKSLSERSLMNEEYGRYWKMSGGAYWYNQKVEAHTMLIEMYRETNMGQEWIDEIKIWLLTQKKVQHWKTTTATANACYALLMDGTDWLEIEKWPEIQVGEYQIRYNEGPVSDRHVLVNPEPGTGYFKTRWSADEITPEMGRVEVTNHHSGPAWGALYWQYFQNMDLVKEESGALNIQRQLFIAEQVEGKTKYVPIEERKPSPGDRIVVRLEMESELDLDYVHLSDRRAAGLEPMDVRSGHQYSGGLGYYLAIKDAANHFFFDRLPKGKHVLEYELRANLPGNYSNGPGTIQCMYAPEYSSHTSGARIVIE